MAKKAYTEPRLEVCCFGEDVIICSETGGDDNYDMDKINPITEDS